MEHILHYVWKHKLFDKNLTTTDGVSIEVIDAGLSNTDGGPDFFNSKIKIGDKIWVGNIEIHQHSDDWFKHKHNTNKAYNSVILHVVEKADKPIVSEDKRNIPQCEIKYPEQIKDNIEFLLNKDIAMPCSNFIRSISSIEVRAWLNNLLLERLERKSNDIKTLGERFNNSWTDIFYVLLSRAMGFGINSDAFERIALNTPLNYILKQSDKPSQIEAMLFGQAGFLDDINNPDEYTLILKQEYEFLKNKYSLFTLDKSIFKLLRIRPTGSPYIRLAQLASLLTNIQGLYSKVLTSKDIGQIRLLFHVNASEYWQTHYALGEETPRKNKFIGDASLDILIINVIVPIIFSTGKRIDDESYIERAISFLESIKPESNSIISLFRACGINAENAGDSQALIQLKREYCEKKKCLYCRIGYKILSQK